VTPLTPEAFNATFDQPERTVVRMETLQWYTVAGEAERIQAWREGRPRPERSPKTSPWLHRIQETTAAGKQWTRYRIVEFDASPDGLSEYVRYELTGYQESTEAGEQIFLADRAADPALDDIRRDWWGFDLDGDHPFVVLMNYTDIGEPLAHELTRDRDVIDRCRQEIELVRPHAVPFADFMAGQANR
jgi:hypothetical protein